MVRFSRPDSIDIGTSTAVGTKLDIDADLARAGLAEAEAAVPYQEAYPIPRLVYLPIDHSAGDPSLDYRLGLAGIHMFDQLPAAVLLLPAPCAQLDLP